MEDLLTAENTESQDQEESLSLLEDSGGELGGELIGESEDLIEATEELMEGGGEGEEVSGEGEEGTDAKASTPTPEKAKNSDANADANADENADENSDANTGDGAGTEGDTDAPDLSAQYIESLPENFRNYLAENNTDPMSLMDAGARYNDLVHQLQESPESFKEIVSSLIRTGIEVHGQELDGFDFEEARGNLPDFEAMTPTEKFLYDRVQRSEQALQQMVELVQKERTDQIKKENGSMYASAVKAAIPNADVDGRILAGFMSETGIQDPVVAWKAMNYDNAVSNASKAAFARGAKSVKGSAPAEASESGGDLFYDPNDPDLTLAKEEALLKQGYRPRGKVKSLI